MNPGKRFEAKFRKSLSLMPGWSMRIFDGGRSVTERMPADFWYFPKSGGADLIECKATRGKSIRHDRVTQLGSLLEFDALSDGTSAFVAVNFYGEDVRRDNRCIIVPAPLFALHAETSGRASLPLSDAVEIGWEAPRISGNLWDLSEFERADLSPAGTEPEYALGKDENTAPEGATEACRGNQYQPKTTEYRKED